MDPTPSRRFFLGHSGSSSPAGPPKPLPQTQVQAMPATILHKRFALRRPKWSSPTTGPEARLDVRSPFDFKVS